MLSCLPEEIDNVNKQLQLIANLLHREGFLNFWILIQIYCTEDPVGKKGLDVT